jgi:hypothetical protein
MDSRNCTSPGCHTARGISLFSFYKISQNDPANDNPPTQNSAVGNKSLPHPLTVGADVFLQTIEGFKKQGFNPLVVYGLAFSAMHVNAKALNDPDYRKLADSWNQSITDIIAATNPAITQNLIGNPILYRLGLKPQQLVQFYSGSLFASLDYHYDLKGDDPVANQLRQNYEKYAQLLEKVKRAAPQAPAEKRLEYQTKLLVMDWLITSFNLDIDNYLAHMANNADNGRYTGGLFAKVNLITDLSGLFNKLSQNKFIDPVIQHLKATKSRLIGNRDYLTANVLQPYFKYKEAVGDGSAAMKLVMYDLMAQHLRDNPALMGQFNIKQAEELARLSLQANLPPTFDEFVNQVKTNLQGRSAIEVGLPEGIFRTPAMYIGGGLGTLLGLSLVAIFNLFAGKKSKTSYWAYLIAAVLGAVLGGYAGRSFGRYVEELPLVQS